MGQSLGQHEDVRTAWPARPDELAAIMDEASFAVLLLDREWRVQSANQAAAEIIGRPVPEMVGRSLLGFALEDDREDVERHFASLDRENPTATREHRMRLPNGEVRWQQWVDRAIFDAQGEPVAFRSVGRDTTRRKAAEKALRRSEAQYRNVVENVPDIIMTVDRLGTIQFINRTVPGLTVAGTIGTKIYDYIPAEYHELEREALERALESGKTSYVEVPGAGPNGTPAWYESRIVPIGEEGRGDQAIIISTDITARRRAEAEVDRYRAHLEESVEDRTAELRQANEQLRKEIAERERVENALRESEAKHRALVEQLPVITYTAALDEASTTLYISPQVEGLIGYAPEEYATDPGRRRERLHPDDRERVLRELAECRRTGRRFASEYRVVARDGHEVWFRDEAAIVRDRAGRPLFLQGIMLDISDRKRAEERREAAEGELEQQRILRMRADRLRSLGEMAAGIAHELNQPLTGVRGLAELLLIGAKKGWDIADQEVREKLETIVEQSDRMTRVIEHVRMFAREAGKHERRPVLINHIVRSSMEMLDRQFRAHGLELECDLAEDLPMVSANPFSLEQVVINLLTNARDAAEERLATGAESGGGQIRMRTFLEYEAEAPRVGIQVTDRGLGIPGEVLPQVFDPFFTTKGPDRGTGLGLAISKSIVEEFGGEITVDSGPGQGTTATILLPTAVSQEQ